MPQLLLYVDYAKKAGRQRQRHRQRDRKRDIALGVSICLSLSRGDPRDRDQLSIEQQFAFLVVGLKVCLHLSVVCGVERKEARAS